MELSVTSVLKLGALPIAESAKTQMFESKKNNPTRQSKLLT